MNKGNFTATQNFPVSTYTYEFLQQMTHLVGELAALGGANYILSGCTLENNQVSDGIVVINGELLPFVGGTLKEKVTIKVIKQADHFAGVNYPESYILRTAEFSDIGEYKWDDLTRVLTNRQLEEKINSIRSEAPGFVKSWSGLIERLPAEYRLCNGDTVTVAEFPDLAYFYGKEREEGFKLPDLRKRFIVGYDNADDDYNQIGKVGGAAKKKITKDQMPVHEHVYSDDTNAMGSFILDGKSFPTKVVGINNMESSAKSGGTGTLYNSSEAGKGEEFDVRPPFYTLAYVVRVKY